MITLKSAREIEAMDQAGDFIARATASGIEWFTCISSTSKQPSFI